MVYSDIKFLIGPNRKAIYGHRILLSARCDVFRAMFLDQANAPPADKDAAFVLADITPDIFLAVFEFIYTNCVTLTSKNVSNFNFYDIWLSIYYHFWLWHVNKTFYLWWEQIEKIWYFTFAIRLNIDCDLIFLFVVIYYFFLLCFRPLISWVVL